jgi:nicotinamide mononucleotide transporter
MNGLEIAGTVLGVLGVWLMIRQNIWGWPVGLVQVTVYGWVFYQAKLYSDVILQGFFFVIQAYGWVHWLGKNGVRGSTPATASASAGVAAHLLPVTRLTPVATAAWIAAGGIVSAGWGTYMQRTTDAALPHWDAFILVFSLIAQWLQARKKLECWAGWIVVNTVAIGVYWAKDLFLTAGLYALFWLMAAWGWREWRQTMGGARA